MSGARRSDPGGGRIRTSLGPTLEHLGSIWSLDLTDLPIFHGLSVLSRALGEIIIDQARSDRIDITAERSIRPRENPELLHHLGVVLLKVAAEHATVTRLVRDPELFQDRLRAVFGTLQRRRYRTALFPETDDQASRALVYRFPFPAADREGETRTPYTFLLERVASPRNKGQCCLRITIEDPSRARLNLASIEHMVVEDLEGRTFIAGSTRIAETWAEGLRREAERSRRRFLEKRQPHSHLFKQLDKAGLGMIEEVSLRWSDAFVDRILESDPAELSHLLKRVMLAMEDRGLRRLLAGRETVRIVCNDAAVYVDQSQLGRVLNLSLGGPRERVDVDGYLARMPVTGGIVETAPPAPLQGVKVFLIHHITAEVLGLIAALRRLGCRDLTTLFVAYAGEAPSSYLGPLLELPPEEFRCMALVNVPDDESVEGHYKLSGQYSAIENGVDLTAGLGGRRMRFFEAMQSVAAAEFLGLVSRAEQAGERCLILEDGGYLAPALNRACLEGLTVGEFLRAAGHDSEDDRGLSDLLGPRLIGSVEHTRNGMNRLADVERERGTLAFPAFTIAVSKRKIEVEAREVAVTILNAVENVLHATGRILSRRSCLVLGSRGAIGRHLVRGLGERLLVPGEQVLGVDLEAGAGGPFAYPECTSPGEWPEARWLDVDLVLGVIGESVLRGEDLAAWLVRSPKPELVLASGSTKTEEFAGLAAWVDERLGEAEPRVDGRPAVITVREVTDPITGRLYGHRYCFEIEMEEGPRRRDVVFLANLTPVNFMFYGVPTEVIDEVLAELLGASLGLVRRSATERIPPRLHAVDYDVTPTGDPM